MSKGLEVAYVEANSIAEELEIFPGDRIIAVNDEEINDLIDFQYLTAEEEFTILLEKKNGEIWEVEIEREPGEVLGLEVEAVSSQGLKVCKNNCVFCFVAQMPEGMRPSLYEKDDDYRLSLTQGSFITLSNLTEQEVDRILNLRLSPLYISVHAWDSQARVRLMKNPKTGDVSKLIKEFVEAGIVLHTQIVLVPDYNDKQVLQETVAELGKLFPAVQSIAVVPVGLTKHRKKLPNLRTFTALEAQEILEVGHKWQEEFFTKYGTHLVYFSDEFYAMAQMEFPDPEVYDDFPQLENGVGMASRFRAELELVWHQLPDQITLRKIHLITGVSAASFFAKIKNRLQQIKGLEIEIHVIKNQFFGETVTVAGLLTAQDIAAQTGDLAGEEFIIPRVMLKADEDIFLDDKYVAWLEEKLNGKAIIADNDGAAFLEAVLGYALEVE
ncbi:MAG: DUF512 domain-containing protein [Desulfitobacterium hafniense]|nr:DUF512 domain-containing protein [Desulfitobacterium hafniense]